MNDKKILLSQSKESLESEFKNLGLPKFRVQQILDACYQGKKTTEITNISKKDLELISANYILEPINMISKQESKDGTIKFGLKLFDGNIIEAVLMNYKYGNTVCVSTQVGCRMGCKFCASTIGGLVRNLESGEMIGQIVFINNFLGGDYVNRKVTNIVLMGCGEPLDNYDNVTDFIRKINDEKYINISQRNISLSTCGLVKNIYRLADDGFNVNLTISLHAGDDDTRKELMNVAKAFSIKEVIEASDYYYEKTHRRVYYEYTLCKGVNDSFESADRLIKLLKGKVCHINVINLNAVKERNLQSAEGNYAYKFCEYLVKGGLSATVRRSLGQDIDGACGQLRKRLMDNK